MKPIISWVGFGRGTTDDITTAYNQWFSLLSGIDVKSNPWVMKLTRDLSELYQPQFFTNGGTFYNDKIITKTVSWTIDNFSGAGTPANPQPMNVYGAGGGGLGVAVRELLYDSTNGYNWRMLVSNPNFNGTGNSYQPDGQPYYADMEVFQNRIVYPMGQTKLQSVYWYTTGNFAIVQCTNWSNTITLTEGTWDQKILNASGYISDGYTWTYPCTISGYTNTTTATLSSNFSWTTGLYRISLKKISDGWLRDDNSVVALTLPNKTRMYRPMTVFWRQLYVADGSKISKLSDDGLWSSSIIDVWSDFTIKKFTQVNGYIYILADKFLDKFAWLSDMWTPTAQSVIFVWDGTSKQVNNFIEIGTHCHAIEAFENKLYAILKQRDRNDTQDGLAFAYFTWSDFPTIARIDADVAFPNCIAWERGRIFIGASRGEKWGIYTYSSYSNEAGSVQLEKPISNSEYVYSVNIAWLSNPNIFGALWHFFNTSYGSFTNWLYRASGDFETNWIEISPNQFWQLVKGIQLSFLQDLPTDSKCEIRYALDGSPTYELLGTIDSSNMYEILLGMYVRPRKIKIKGTIFSDTNHYYTPEITKIQLY